MSDDDFDARAKALSADTKLMEATYVALEERASGGAMERVLMQVEGVPLEDAQLRCAALRRLLGTERYASLELRLVLNEMRIAIEQQRIRNAS